MNEIRQADAADYPRMAAIEQRCFRNPWSATAFAEFAEHGGVILIHGEQGVVRGYILTSFVLDEGNIAKVAVDPDAQRRGVATQLFAELEKEAAKRQVTKLFLEVRVTNAGAIALYEKTGFVPIGIRKEFYRNPTEDAQMYRKDLI